LKNYIANSFKVEIPLNVNDEELIVRGILHPLFIDSKSKFKREAFLPPFNRNDVSLLRRKYTNDSFCKDHCASLRISGNKYLGMATFIACHVDEINKSSDISVKPKLVATPLNEEKEIIAITPVYKTTRGLPMHADLLYPSPLIKGQPNTQYRKFANEMIKIANYFPDPKPDEKGWEGSPLNWEKKENHLEG